MLYAGWSMPLFSCDLSQQVDCPDFEVAGGFALRFPSWFIVLHFLGAPTHTFEIIMKIHDVTGALFWTHTKAHLKEDVDARLQIIYSERMKSANQKFPIPNIRQKTHGKKHACVLSISHHFQPRSLHPLKNHETKKPPKTAQETQVAMPMVSKKSTTAKSQSYILRQVSENIFQMPRFEREVPKIFWKRQIWCFFWNSGWKSCGSIGMKTNM